jgi:hypothetical protein
MEFMWFLMKIISQLYRNILLHDFPIPRIGFDMGGGSVKKAYQTIKLQLREPFTLEEQHRFWKKMHANLKLTREWYAICPGEIWVDLIYLPNREAEVYLTLPDKLISNLPSFFKKRGRRTSKGQGIFICPGSVDFTLPQEITLCELKLTYENLFALSHHEQNSLPLTLQLDKNEIARLSFCFKPTSSRQWTVDKSYTVKAIKEKGIRLKRENVGPLRAYQWFFFLVDQIMSLVIRKEKQPSLQGDQWLSKETIRKMNDSLFKAYIRIAAPQRLLPKLQKMFSIHDGDNSLKINFLSRSEQMASRKEIIHHRLGLYSLTDLHPNVLCSREIARAFPIFSTTASAVEGEKRRKI